MKITSAKWWEPHNPERSLHGVLQEDADHGWTLLLDGTFQDLPTGPPGIPMPVGYPKDIPVLLGSMSDGRGMTLVDCQVLNGTLPVFGSAGSMKLWPQWLAYDIYLENIEDFKMTELSLRYSNVDIWMDTSGFNLSRQTLDGESIDIRYARPADVQITLPEGMILDLQFVSHGPTLMTPLIELHITQHVWISVKALAPTDYETLIGTITTFSDLITLGIGQPIRPLEMEASYVLSSQNDGQPSTQRSALVHNRKPIAPTLPDITASSMIFSFPDIRDRLQEIVLSWFEQQGVIRPLYNLYFGTIRSPKMYVEHRFLNMFQALESYHRRIFQHPPADIEAHKERSDRLLANVTGKDRKWLKGQLRHSHEPQAVDRIRSLAAKLNAQWILSDDEIELAANMRNFHTHFDSKVEERLPPPEERTTVMHNLAIRLQLLCELVLLTAIGFSSELARQRLERARRLQRIIK